MSRGNALRYPNAHESTAAARARLANLLLRATDKAFAGFDVDFLVRVHRVPQREVEAMLLAEQRRRAGR
jgi:hypothetical protein